jgi:hypothetical protein
MAGKLIQLTMVQGERMPEHDEDGEPIGQGTTETSPVTIQAGYVRCWYPRKAGKPGTRITFSDGSGFAVTESYAEVTTAISGDPRQITAG